MYIYWAAINELYVLPTATLQDWNVADLQPYNTATHIQTILTKKYLTFFYISDTLNRVKSKRDAQIWCRRIQKRLRTQAASHSSAVFVKKSCLDQCLSRFIAFSGQIFSEKKPCGVRVWIWAYGAPSPLGAKRVLLQHTIPFEGNWNFYPIPA